MSNSINPVPDRVTKEEAIRWFKQGLALFMRRPLSITFAATGLPLLLCTLLYLSFQHLAGALGANDPQDAAASLIRAFGPMISLGGCLLGGMLMAGAADNGSSRWLSLRTYLGFVPIIFHVFFSAIKQSPLLFSVLTGLPLASVVVHWLTPVTGAPETFQTALFWFVISTQANLFVYSLCFYQLMLPWHHHGLLAEGSIDKTMPPTEVVELTVSGIELSPAGNDYVARKDGGLPYVALLIACLVLLIAVPFSDIIISSLSFVLVPVFSCFAYACHRERFRGRKDNLPARKNAFTSTPQTA